MKDKLLDAQNCILGSQSTTLQLSWMEVSLCRLTVLGLVCRAQQMSNPCLWCFTDMAMSTVTVLLSGCRRGGAAEELIVIASGSSKCTPYLDILGEVLMFVFTQIFLKKLFVDVYFPSFSSTHL